MSIGKNERAKSYHGKIDANLVNLFVKLSFCVSIKSSIRLHHENELL